MAHSCDEGLDRVGYGGLRSMMESGGSLLEFVETNRFKEKAILDADDPGLEDANLSGP